MAVKVVSPPLILISIIISIAFLSTTNAGGIVTYWGQNRDEGTLADACNSGLYQIVNIAFLSTFGNGQTPQLNLAGHCDAKSNQCQRFSSDVRNCQSKNVKVLLSIGGQTSTYSLSSADDARSVANYIWNNFLGGNSGSRPLGDAVLDGVDFDIETGRGDYYADLAGKLLELSAGKKLYLTAAPQCPVSYSQPLQTLFSSAINFDYVWIQFYNNPKAACEFSSSNPANFQGAWKKWISSVKGGKFYVGLPASPAAAKSGYVSVQDLTSQVLPFVKQNSGKYGGVMVWKRFEDKQTGYSSQVKGRV